MRQRRRWRALALLLSLMATGGALARWGWGRAPGAFPAHRREPAPAVVAKHGAPPPRSAAVGRPADLAHAVRMWPGQSSAGRARALVSGRVSRSVSRTVLATALGTVLAASLTVLPTGAAQASPICQWVDAQGRTQMARVVPERYKKSVRCIDSQSHELPEAERDAAQQRQAAERAQVQREALQAQASPVLPLLPGSLSADALTPAVTKRPAEAVTDATDCPTWRRLF